MKLRILRPVWAQSNQAAEGARAPAPPALDRQHAWTFYLLALVGNAIAFVALFWFTLAALKGFEILPPPQLSNNLCIDQKLAYFRGHDIERPMILIVGSSVAWRGIDSEVIREESGSTPLNGAFCGLKLNQTEFTAAYLVAHYPNVRSLVVALAPEDLTACKTTNPRTFDPQDVDDFVFHHDNELKFYLKYFDPVTLAKNALILRALQRGDDPFESIMINRYGDAPIDTNVSRRLLYGALPSLDPVCLAALQKLARDSRAQGRQLFVVTMPISPTWKKLYDPSGATMQDVSRDIQTAVAGTGAIFWDANRDFPMASGDFVDAIHIRWSAAKVFSQALVLATQLGGGSNRASND